MVPQFEKADQYPATNGRDFCVGEWKTCDENPSKQEAYITLKYAPFSNMLLAVKFGGMIELWDCNEQVKKAKDYKQDDIEQCKADFSRLDEPLKEFAYMIDGKIQTPTCATWLLTDANLIAVGYENGHVALFDVK